MSGRTGDGAGRPKGAKDRNYDPARRGVSRQNPAKPHITLDDEIRAELTAAKGKLARALTTRGVEWLITIIDEGPARWERTASGERVLVEGNTSFEWAMNFAADRAGMPRKSEAEVQSHAGGFTITVSGVGGGLGWPGMAVAGGDAHDERDRPHNAH